MKQASTMILISCLITPEKNNDLEEIAKQCLEDLKNSKTFSFMMTNDLQREQKDSNMELDLKFLVILKIIETNTKEKFLEISFYPVIFDEILILQDISQGVIKICLERNTLDYGSFSYDCHSCVFQFRSTFLFSSISQEILINRLLKIRELFADVVQRLSQEYVLKPEREVSIILTRQDTHIKTKQNEFLKELRSKQQTSSILEQVKNSKHIDYIEFFIDKNDIANAKSFDNGGFHEIFKLPTEKYSQSLAYKTANEKYAPKIQNEIKILHSISSCDYIVQAYRSKQWPNILFMEYCQYKNLRIFLNLFMEVISLKTKLKILHQVGLGISHLHQAGIQHFDLKPENILIDDKFTPKICDFGESFFVKKGPSSTPSRTYSIPYQAPECLQQNYIPTLASDVFSFGVIIFEVIFQFQPILFARKQNYLQKFRSLSYEIEDYNYLIGLGPKYVFQVILDLTIQCMFTLMKACFPLRNRGLKLNNYVTILVQSMTLFHEIRFCHTILIISLCVNILLQLNQENFLFFLQEKFQMIRNSPKIKNFAQQLHFKNFEFHKQMYSLNQACPTGRSKTNRKL